MFDVECEKEKNVCHDVKRSIFYSNTLSVNLNLKLITHYNLNPVQFNYLVRDIFGKSVIKIIELNFNNAIDKSMNNLVFILITTPLGLLYTHVP